MPINYLNNLRGAVTKRLGMAGPLQVLAYRGYGSADQLCFRGRVLRDDGLHPCDEDWPLWKNALNMFRRFDHDEVSGARLRLTFNDQTHEVETDKAGFFIDEVRPHAPLADDTLWHEAHIELLEPRSDQGSVQAVAQMLVPRSQAQFGVISDIDDTIVHTSATDLWQMIRLAYLGNSQTRLPIPGVPDLYQALQVGGDGQHENPIFYVSSSAWNMYDLFEEFMDAQGLPAGPISLVALDLSWSKLFSFEHSDHKRGEIEPILDQYPELPFILIGDSGQKDPEIYTQIACDHPNRIACIYIRNIPKEHPDRQPELEALAEQVRQAGSELVTFEDAIAVAHHAHDRGWIEAHAIEAVQQSAATASPLPST
ncbi:App1 family protein [Nodosilinea sp. E11]|uniref:App1 family protein n=1 Tax=Nodosilinea sp. E11 TaxID=3037479 RepID=UPI0029350469|nr:phosphatase domain-containing protein [Nodosilinea sp. E11]WOD37757.1 phosphatase domain-containing protein [Nodosilinea sp. E11]